MVMENRVGDIVIEAWAVKAVVEPVVAAAKAATLASLVPQSIIAAWACLTGCTLVMGTDVMLVAAQVAAAAMAARVDMVRADTAKVATSITLRPKVTARATTEHRQKLKRNPRCNHQKC